MTSDHSLQDGDMRASEKATLISFGLIRVVRYSKTLLSNEVKMTDNSGVSALQKLSQRIIAGNAIFLIVMAVFGISQDILSYKFGTGRFDAFLHNDPRAVGMIEAHGLAGILAIAAFVHIGTRRVFWHGLLGTVHAFLGSCNLIFFEGYVQTGTTIFATVVTVVHFGLAALHVFVSLQLPRRSQA
jgi:hypothetical protein